MLDKPIEQNTNRLLRHSVSCTAAPILFYRGGRINVQGTTGEQVEGKLNDLIQTYAINDQQQQQQLQQELYETKRFCSRRHRTTTYDPSYISRSFAELTIDEREYTEFDGGLYTPNSVDDLIKAETNARKLVLRQCGQYVPLEFNEKYSNDILKYCRKIGEGVFGEVFLNKRSDGRAVVLKIIPIEGTIEVNGEPQKKFDEILPEILIAKQLSNLRSDNEFMTSGFVEVINVSMIANNI